jgi:hypothetical protein
MITPRQLKYLAWAFVSAAAIIFVLRGPLRALSGGFDFAAPYAATVAWVRGDNPYDPAVVSSILENSGRERDGAGRPLAARSAYPPPSFLVLAPLSPLSWKSARLAWSATLIVLFVLHLRALLRICDLRPCDTRGLFLIGGVLALAPYHTGMALGQLSIASVELLIIAIALVVRNSTTAAAWILGLAVATKPPIAAPFVIYFLFRSRRTMALMAAAISASIAAAAIAWMWWHRISWIAPLRANIAAEFSAAIDPAGPLSPQMIDLRPLLVSLTATPNPGAVGVVLTLIAAWVVYRRQRNIHDELLLLSAAAVLTLLIGYHRFYDAALLSLPLAWAIRGPWQDDSTPWPAIGVLLCAAVFFVPGAVLLDRVSQSHAFIWDAIVLRHQTWALVAMLAFLFVGTQDVHSTTFASTLAQPKVGIGVKR